VAIELSLDGQGGQGYGSDWLDHGQAQIFEEPCAEGAEIDGFVARENFPTESGSVQGFSWLCRLVPENKTGIAEVFKPQHSLRHVPPGAGCELLERHGGKSQLGLEPEKSSAHNMSIKIYIDPQRDISTSQFTGNAKDHCVDASGQAVAVSLWCYSHVPESEK